MVGGDEQGEALHFFDKGGNEIGKWRGLEGATVESGLGCSGIGDRERKKQE